MNNIYNKQDAYKTLDTVNMWINNCDSKASILLGFYGVIISIFLLSDCIVFIRNCFNNIIQTSKICGIIYITLSIIFPVLFAIGIFQLAMVIVPHVTLGTNQIERFDSVMFYGSISNIKSYNEYCKKIKKTYDNDIIDDLLFQIYSASKICNNKFRHLKIGLLLSLYSICLFSIVLIVGAIGVL